MSRIHHGAARDLKDFDNDGPSVGSQCQAFTRRPSVRRGRAQTPQGHRGGRAVRSAQPPGRGRRPGRAAGDSEPDHPGRPDRPRVSDGIGSACQGSVDSRGTEAARPDHSEPPGGPGGAGPGPRRSVAGWHPIGPSSRRGRPATWQVSPAARESLRGGL
eukprot:545579-Hanusia_phi.AAC.1